MLYMAKKKYTQLNARNTVYNEGLLQFTTMLAVFMLQLWVW